jgi:hypothetical protein
MFTRTCHCSLSWVRHIWSTVHAVSPISLRSILIWSSHLCLHLPPGLFTWSFLTSILCAFLISPVCYMPYPSHSPWLDHSNNFWMKHTSCVVKVYLWMLWCGNIVLLTIRFLCGKIYYFNPIILNPHSWLFIWKYLIFLLLHSSLLTTLSCGSSGIHKIHTLGYCKHYPLYHLFSSVGTCTFRTIKSYQRPLSITYNILPQISFTPLNADLIPYVQKSLSLSDD